MKRFDLSMNAVQSTPSAMYPSWFCHPWPF
jgi:hypothetical protein